MKIKKEKKMKYVDQSNANILINTSPRNTAKTSPRVEVAPIKVRYICYVRGL